MTTTPPSEHRLARLIRTGMAEHNLSQTELAHAAGISKQLVQQILDPGRAPLLPRKATLEGLASALHIGLPTVMEAALRDAGYWVQPVQLEDLPDGSRELLVAAGAAPPEAVRHVTGLLKSFAAT